MLHSLHPQGLIDHAMTEAGPLARELLNVVQDELDAQPRHFPLREGWRKVRSHFAADFEGKLLELLQAGRRGDDPLERSPLPLGGLESLSLVDEHQALQDVAIAHVAHTAEELSRAELHQIGNFFAALRGIARARERDNPLRPALYAHALHHALAASPLAAQAQYELMRVAATPLARALNRMYRQACAMLHAADIGDMVASHGHVQTDPLAHQRLAAARGVGARPGTVHGTLDGLSRRVDAINSRPQGLGKAAQRDAQAPAPFVRTTGPDMLSRLYDQILADPRLLPPLKALLARLQIAVVRLARTDTMLLRRQDHPTWTLLNRVAAHGMAFGRADDPRFVDFLRLMDAEAQLLVDAPTPTALLFQQALARVDSYIDQQARQSSERNAVALAALEREQQRADWRELLREQIDHQLVGAPLGPRMHRFLQTSWVDVIVDAMVRHGRDSREAQAAMEVVDAVLDSLITPRDLADREALRMRLPVLIERLVTGCDSIQLTEARREPPLTELMAQHARLLRGLPALDPAERRPLPRPAAEAAPASADEIVERLMEERDSQVPSHWMRATVDRGELPTVPTQLYNEDDSPDARAALQRWIDGVEIGRWFHLFIQGDWHTAQCAWISEGRQFMLFVGRDSDERLPLTRRALGALLANGLITALEDDNVVQRAVDTLMSDLDGG